MLLITCPWCGPRAHIEFTYGGDATVDRPADPDAVSADEWLDHVYLRDNPRGPHNEWWQQQLRLPGAGSRSGATPGPTACTGAGRPAPTSARTSIDEPPDPPNGAGRAHRPFRFVRVHLRRRALHGIPGRHAGLRAARERRPARGAQLQVPPPPGHLRVRSRGAQRARPRRHRTTGRAEPEGDPGRAVRRARGREPEPLADARIRRGGAGQHRLEAVPGRFLLQDVHVARLVVDALRALHPQGRRGSGALRSIRTPITTTAATPSATCS